jgi:hypothetical protein
MTDHREYARPHPGSLEHQATAYIAEPFGRDTPINTLQNPLSTVP